MWCVDVVDDPVVVSGGLRRAFKFRLRPTCQQESKLVEMLADFCDLYNCALEHRITVYRQFGVSIDKAEQSADLPAIRASSERQGRWSARGQQEVLNRLDLAYAAFFRRLKAGQTPGFPRFKSRARWDSAVLVEGNGARWIADTSRVAIVGVGHVKVHAHREIRGRVKTITVRREGRHWYVVFACDQVPAQILPPTGRAVGVDVGINVFAATSDRDLHPNPRHGRKSAGELAGLQRRHQQTGRRSAKRRRRIGELHRKIGRQRLDHHHKLARQIINTYDMIAVEELAVVNMVKRPKPNPDRPGEWLPNGAAAKTGLNRSISDAGWAQFIRILNAKAEEAGRRVIAVPAHHTSQTCTNCEHVHPGNRDGEAFRCLDCGHQDHADINASINILQRGLALLPPA